MIAIIRNSGDDVAVMTYVSGEVYIRPNEVEVFADGVKHRYQRHSVKRILVCGVDILDK